MNYKRYPANILLVTLFLLSGILIALFLAKDNTIDNTQKSNAFYHTYLNEMMSLIKLNKQNKNQQCNENKKEIINIQLRNLDYTFHCQRFSLFKKPYNSKKYISLKAFSDELDLESYQTMVYKITSLADLPDSTIDDPKIVLAQNDIDETLTKNFYGIILTNHLFDISGSAKIYGKLYSTFDNEREERNLTYIKEVLEKLEQVTTTWQYLPHSTRIKAHEKSP